MSTSLAIIGAFIAAALLTGTIKRIASHAELMDLPVARSAHSTPIPVGGGIAIALVFLISASFIYLSSILALHEYLALLGGAFIAGLGFIDDWQKLDIKWRVPVQFLAATWSIWWLGGSPAIVFGDWVLPASWPLNVIAVVALVWLMNLYNFMDGIDGIAGSELVFVNALCLLIVVSTGDGVLSLLSATMIGAGAGFLVWNWSPAKIFLGDAGSGFIGFSLGIMALLSMHHGSMQVWTWVLLLGVFIVDATVTLFRRVLRGDKWYEGHASHAYQNLARRYQSHAKVTITVILINCFWLAPLAWCSVIYPQLGVYLTILGLVPLGYLAIYYNAGVAGGKAHEVKAHNL